MAALNLCDAMLPYLNMVYMGLAGMPLRFEGWGR